MACSISLNKVCFFLVTGASRGIGQTMAVECARRMKPGSTVLLAARTAAGLEATRSQILALNPDLNVVAHAIDLAKPSDVALQVMIDGALAKQTPQQFEQAVVIHNVGTLGDVSQLARECSDATVWDDYLATNVVSVVRLNNLFMETFKDVPRYVVNITSKASTVPFGSFTYYCAGKAAREMYFRVLAEEEKGNSLVVLNYSPGPVDTEMTVYAQNASSSDKVRKMFRGLRDSSTILTTAQTTAKFLEVIEGGQFTSGDVIDYYDRD